MPSSLSIAYTWSNGTLLLDRCTAFSVEDCFIDWTSLPTVFPRDMAVRSKWKIYVRKMKRRMVFTNCLTRAFYLGSGAKLL